MCELFHTAPANTNHHTLVAQAESKVIYACKQVWGKPKGRREDLFDQSSEHPNVPYVSIVEAGEDPTKVNSWLDLKWSLSTNSTKWSSFIF